MLIRIERKMKYHNALTEQLACSFSSKKDNIFSRKFWGLPFSGETSIKGGARAATFSHQARISNAFWAQKFSAVVSVHKVDEGLMKSDCLFYFFEMTPDTGLRRSTLSILWIALIHDARNWHNLFNFVRCFLNSSSFFMLIVNFRGKA